MARTAFAALLLLAAAAHAGGDMHSLFYGEPGTKPPVTTGSTGDYMETSGEQAAQQARRQPVYKKEAPAKSQTPSTDVETAYREELPPAPESGLRDAPNSPEITPRGLQREESAKLPMPAPARIGAFVPRDPAQQRYFAGPSREPLAAAAASPRSGKSSKNYKLWDSVGQPLEMSAAQVNKTAGADEASSAAGAEYERRILGTQSLASEPMRDAMAATAPSLAAAPKAANEVFVSVDVSATEQAGLKDAVAGLSSAGGFRLDPRFPPQASDFTPSSGPDAAAKAATSLRGWMPADKVPAVVSAPGVLRVQVDHGGPHADYADAAKTTLVVGLRIPAQASAGETFQRQITDLAASAHFKWTRTVGFQAVPNSKDVALVVVGEVPVSRIPKLLESPDVLKVGPAPLDVAHAEPEPRKPTRLEDFLSYTRQRAPLLLALTLLLLLPTVGGALLKFGEAFVPYDR